MVLHHLLLLVLLSLGATVQGTTYYVSSSIGNDRYPGTAPTQPWKTFNQLYTRAYIFQPGDTILFCQGDVWQYANLFAFSGGRNNAPITWGSYQCGRSTDKPVISPSVTLTSRLWQQQGDMLVYPMATDAKAVAAGVRAMWVDNIRHLPARYPNLLNITQTTLSDEREFLFNTPSTMVDRKLQHPSLNQPRNHWVGATVYMRNSNWLYAQSRVVASDNGWIQVEYQPGDYVSGFYIEQSLNPLGYVRAPLLQADSPGEWTYDMQAGNLYFYPATQNIKRGILDGTKPVYMLYGDAISAATITGVFNVIQDIEFRYTMSGISNNQRNQFTARRNTIKYAVGWGINSGYAGGSVIDSNTIVDAEADCIILDSAGGVISNNDLNGCGLIAGYGFGYGAASTGIVSMNADVVGNKIRNTGYSGITPHAVRRVSFNQISGVLKTLNDGGGIYMFGGVGAATTIEGNVIENVIGNYVPWTPWNIASCVFTDQGTSGITVYNNSCYTTPQCMQLNSAYGNMILSNRCDSPGIYMNDFISQQSPRVGGHGVIGNVIVTRGTDSRLQNPIHRVRSPGRSNLKDVATYYFNRYCQAGSSDTSYMFQKDFGENGFARYNTFGEWQTGECATWPNPSDCNFEQDSFYRYNDCNTVRPYVFGESLQALREYGRQLLAQEQQEQSDRTKKIVGGVVGGVAGVVLIIAALVMYIRRASKQSPSELTFPSSSPSNIRPGFRSMDSPATGEFELAVTPEMKRGFSWADSTIQSSSM